MSDLLTRLSSRASESYIPGLRAVPFTEGHPDTLSSSNHPPRTCQHLVAFFHSMIPASGLHLALARTSGAASRTSCCHCGCRRCLSFFLPVCSMRNKYSSARIFTGVPWPFRANPQKEDTDPIRMLCPDHLHLLQCRHVDEAVLD